MENKLWFNFNTSDNLWFNAKGERKSSEGRKITINGDVNNIRGAIEQAKRQGVISESQSGRAEVEVKNSIASLTPTPENPDPGKEIQM